MHGESGAEGTGRTGRFHHWLNASVSNQTTLAALVLTMTFVVLLGSISYAITRQLLAQRLENELGNVARLVAQRLDFRLRGSADELERLAGNTLVANALVTPSEQTYLQAFLRDFRLSGVDLSSLCLIGFAGNTIACNRPAPVDHVQQPWTRQVIDQNRAHIAFIPEGNRSRIVLAFPVPFRTTERPQGALVAELDPRPAFNEAVSPLEPKIMVRLLTGDGQELARTATPRRTPVIETRVQLELPSVLGNHTLSLVVSEPAALALAPVHAFGLAYLATGLSLIPIVLWFSRRIASRLTASLKALTDEADRIAAAGGYQLSLQNGSDEVQRLSHAFQAMLSRLQVMHQTLERRVEERTAELRRREAHLAAQRRDYRTIIDSVPALIWSIAADGRVIRANRHAATYVGRSMAAVIGLNLYDTLYPDLKAEALWENREVMESGRPLLKRVRKVAGSNGRVDWFSTDKIPFRDEDDHIVGITVVMENITEQIQAQEQLKASEGRYRQLVENSPEPWIVQTCDRLVYVNREALRLFGAQSPRQLLGHTLKEWLLPQYHSLLEQRCREVFDKHQRMAMELVRFTRLDGTIIEVEIIAIPTEFDGQPAAYAVLRDVTERNRALERERLAATVYEYTREGIMITDADSRIVAVNRAFTDITGYSESEALGQTPQMLKSERQDADFYRVLWDTLKRVHHWQGEIWNRRKDGSTFPEWLSIAAVRNGAGQVTHYVAIFSDITVVKESERQLKNLAYYDTLTELPNRLLFFERLRHALAQRERQISLLALLFVDLDHFKNINDTLGHDAGDRLLQHVASRIGRQVRAGDTVARLAGDEFIVLLERPHSTREIAHVAERILAELGRPVDLDGKEVYTGASIGIAVFPGDGRDVETLLKAADAAMYRAKAQGRNTFVFYEPAMAALSAERLQLETDLRRALLRRDELQVFYQPQIGHGSALAGVEALCRWQHPERGLLAPDVFVAVAEESGLIRELDWWLLDAVCGQYRQWLDTGMAPPRVGINFSGLHVHEHELFDNLQTVLQRYDLDGSWLELEFTENCMMQPSGGVIELLHELKRLGLSIAIDDFGTGCSSLGYLKRFPVDVIKIDRSFVTDLPDDEQEVSIVRAILAMAAALDLRVIAEGVETEAQRDFLLGAGCDELQGYLFAQPMPAEELASQWLSGRTSPQGTRRTRS